MKRDDDANPNHSVGERDWSLAGRRTGWSDYARAEPPGGRID